MYHKYILLILNCQKYKWKAELQKTSWLKQLPDTIKYFHIVADPSKCNGDIFSIDNDANIIYTNTKDDYLSLPHKMISAIAAIHSSFTYDYIFKTDDDQMLINPNFFNELIPKLGNHVHYGGHVLTVNTHNSAYWQIHDVLPKDLVLEGTMYCTGRFYLLSNYAVSELLKNVADISKRIIEDHTIGYFLSSSTKTNILHLNNQVSSSFIDYDKVGNQ